MKLLVFFFLTLMACAKNEDEQKADTQIFEIDFKKDICIGEGSQWCMRVRKKGEKDFSYFYDQIKGFTYQWGQTCTIEVRVKSNPNPPADGSSLTYELVKTIKTVKTKSGTIIELKVAEIEKTVDLKSNTVSIMGDRFSINPAVNISTIVKAISLKLKLNNKGKFEVAEVVS